MLPGFNGRLFVLVNGGCFSTTSELITFLKENTNAIFIGQESGGGYNGNCSGADAVRVLMTNLTLH